MFSLTIETDNAAFEHCESEVARILRTIADRLDRLDGRNSSECGPVIDANGNRVGDWTLNQDCDD